MGKPTADELAAAAEWRAANAEIAELQTRMAKHGYLSVTADEHAHAHQRLDAAAAAITIPPHLMVYNPGDWPGRADDQAGFTHDAIRRSEQYRQAQDRWTTDRRLWRGDFESLRDRQNARRQPPGAA